MEVTPQDRTNIKAYAEAYPTQPRAFNIPAALLKQLMEQPDTQTVRAYMSLDADKLDLVLAPVDSKGSDIGKNVIKYAPLCPPDCRGKLNLLAE